MTLAAIWISDLLAAVNALGEADDGTLEARSLTCSDLSARSLPRRRPQLSPRLRRRTRRRQQTPIARCPAPCHLTCPSRSRSCLP